MRFNSQPIWLNKKPFEVVGARGFTLIELLIGLTLWVVVSFTLARVFQSGLRSWKRIETMNTMRQESRVVLDDLAREFRNAIDVPGVSWSGDDQEITFSTVEEEEGEATLHVSQVKIEKVTYQLVPVQEPNKAWPDGVPQTFLRRLKQQLSPAGIQTVIETPLTTRPTMIRWEYAYALPQGGIDWQSRWKETVDHSLPCGIRVHLTQYDDAGQSEIFSRTFFTPTARPLPWEL